VFRPWLSSFSSLSMNDNIASTGWRLEQTLARILHPRLRRILYFSGRTQDVVLQTGACVKLLLISIGMPALRNFSNKVPSAMPEF